MRCFSLTLLCLLTTPLLAQKPVLVGYLPQWGLYSSPLWSAKQLVTSGSAAVLDQIDYAQAFIVDGRCAVADPRADIQQPYRAENSVNGVSDAVPPGPDPAGEPLAPGEPLRGEYHQLQLLKQKYPHIRAIISIEGKSSAFSDAAKPEKREAFVASCVDKFLRGNLQPGVSAAGLFSGIDLDWEYPNGDSDGENFNALMLEFRKQLNAYGAATRTPPLLTVAAAPGLGRYPGVDWSLVAKNVDRVGLMNYDYNGPWQKQTGVVAPLYALPGVPLESGNVDSTVTEYEQAGVPAAKLLMGVPFYGYHWSGVTDAGGAHGLGIKGNPEHGDTPYREIAALPGAGTPFRDARSQAPWLYDGDTFWTFEDPVSVAAKAGYVRAHGLGGMMAWELSGDGADGALLQSMHHGLSVKVSSAGEGKAAH